MKLPSNSFAMRLSLAIALACACGLVQAQDASALNVDEESQSEAMIGTSGKLLLTGGVTQIEGSAGGGLTPWAVIGGYGTRDQIGGNAYYTNVSVDDYGLQSYGVLAGLFDRVELSLSRQAFDTQQVGALLGLGRGFTVRQDTYGVKVKLLGDVALEQDSWLPQVSIGAQHKRNAEGAVLAAIGARDDNGTDFYISATKLYLAQGLLLNGTVRFTQANQFGILGFGGDKHDGRKAQLELSAAYLLSRNLVFGVEYRTKPDNLSIATEDNAFDLFVAWAPIKNVSLTVAYADLGTILIRDQQRGVYASLQFGF